MKFTHEGTDYEGTPLIYCILV